MKRLELCTELVEGNPSGYCVPGLCRAGFRDSVAWPALATAPGVPRLAHRRSRRRRGAGRLHPSHALSITIRQLRLARRRFATSALARPLPSTAELYSSPGTILGQHILTS